ncbi:MAG: CDP-alcohol phosphatidyltransferase family protein, partial [Anaerolineales bacterium]
FTGVRLPRHRLRPDAPVIPVFGAGNLLTLARGWCLAVLVGFLVGTPPEGFGRWIPMFAYTASDVADYFDGYLSRRQGIATPLGVALDLELDSIGVLAAVAVAIRLGALPLWFLVFGLARYAYTAMVRIRRWRKLPVYELPPSKSRRPIAGLTMGYLSATLWPILDRPELTLAGLIFLSAFSVSFMRDALVVGGLLDPESDAYQRWRTRLRRVILEWLPIGLRLAVISIIVVEVPRLILQTVGVMEAELPIPLLYIYSGISILASLAMISGWAGRFAAFVQLFPLGLTIAASSMDAPRAFALIAVIGILILGTGRYSLWKPSEWIFSRRAGETIERSD